MNALEKLATLIERKTGVPWNPSVSSNVGAALRREGVSRSPEWERIRNLPRRIFDVAKYPDLSPVFQLPGSAYSLRPLQSAALLEAERANGFVGAMTVGAGKTLTSLLLPYALRSKSAVILIPPRLRSQLCETDIPTISRELRLPLDVIHVVTYYELSHVTTEDVLEKWAPDLIIADEAHRLANRKSSRTIRFLRYFKERPGTRLAILSGSLMNRSIREMQHLIELALRKNSPIPRRYRELIEWAQALDVDVENPTSAGALLDLISDLPEGDEALSIALGDEEGERKLARRAFQVRFNETPGIIVTTGGDCDASLYLFERKPVVPEVVLQAIRDLLATWEIDGEELEDHLAMSRYLRQLSAGFRYRWIWPGGVPDREWLDARSDWHREARDYIHSRARPGMDSEKLLASAAASGRWASTTWSAWARVKHRYKPHPPRETVWISDFLVRDAIAWAKRVVVPESPEESRTNGIVWYAHKALGERIARDGGLPLYGERCKVEPETARPETEPFIVCSARAHGEGKNLQHYNRAYVPTPGASGLAWEQLIGREHRSMQKADEVVLDVCLHTHALRSSFDQAIKDATWQFETRKQTQKLLLARRVRT